MKNIFIVFLTILTLSIVNGQDIELYTLDEATKLIAEQHSYGSGCNVPIFLLCQVMPIFRTQNNSQNDPILTYTSVADLNKIHDYLLPDIQAAAKLNFWKYGNHSITNLEQQKEILKYSDEETWEEYLDNNYKRFFNRNRNEILSPYTNGFIKIYKDEYISGFSAIKGDHIEWSFSSYIDRVNAPRIVSQADAELLLGGNATLVNTHSSLFLDRKKNQNLNSYEMVYDLIWVYEDKAVGFMPRQLYQIVDESGQPLNLLTDKVDTRISEETIAEIATFKIQILFDLIPLDEQDE